MRQLALLCSWGLVAGACGSDRGQSANPAGSGASTATPFRPIISKVDLGDDYFAPDEITVPVGTTVSWQIATGENTTTWPPPMGCSARTIR